MSKRRYNLPRIYAAYNQRYFDGLLPQRVRFEWKPDQRMSDHLAELSRADDGMVSITLSEYLRPVPVFVYRELFHELVHLKLMLHSPAAARVEHGAPFQKEMMRLAEKGAFRRLW